jgi:hypothetical protein
MEIVRGMWEISSETSSDVRGETNALRLKDVMTSNKYLPIGPPDPPRCAGSMKQENAATRDPTGWKARKQLGRSNMSGLLRQEGKCPMELLKVFVVVDGKKVLARFCIGI